MSQENIAVDVPDDIARPFTQEEHDLALLSMFQLECECGEGIGMDCDRLIELGWIKTETKPNPHSDHPDDQHVFVFTAEGNAAVEKLEVTTKSDIDHVEPADRVDLLRNQLFGI